jgi:hypothetical protein
MPGAVDGFELTAVEGAVATVVEGAVPTAVDGAVPTAVDGLVLTVVDGPMPGAVEIRVGAVPSRTNALDGIFIMRILGAALEKPRTALDSPIRWAIVPTRPNSRPPPAASVGAVETPSTSAVAPAARQVEVFHAHVKDMIDLLFLCHSCVEIVSLLAHNPFPALKIVNECWCSAVPLH